jgi:hypothetical protein
MFDRANDFVPTLDTISGPREAGIGAKVRSADSFAQADPLFVGHREDDDPPLLTLEDAGGAGEGVMKSGGFHLASALAGAAELHPDGLTMKIGIKQRDVDVLTLAGSFPMEQGAGDRTHRMGAGADITDLYHRHVGRSVLLTNQGGDSSVGLTNEIKPRVIGERASLAE